MCHVNLAKSKCNNINPKTMKKLSDFLNRISNWKTLLITFAIYMVFNLVLLKNAESKINELTQKTVGVIDLTFGFNPPKTLQMIADYGSSTSVLCPNRNDYRCYLSHNLCFFIRHHFVAFISK